jgi:hypothetical protein
MLTPMSPSDVWPGLFEIGFGLLFAEVCRRSRRDGVLDNVWRSQVGWSRPDWERIQAEGWGQVLLRFGVGFGWFIVGLGTVTVIIGLIG